MKQIKILTRLELCNLYGINTLRHTKDSTQKKKNILFAVIIAVVLVILLGYLVALCVGLSMLGAADVTPAYLLVIAGAFILLFDVFKMGGTLFRKKGYDIMASLPVSNGEIVASRFIRLYVESLLIAALIMAPGIVVYAVLKHPGFGFYVAAILGTLSAPLLPLSAAVFLGALITGISSRMKNKALAEMVFSIVLVLVALGGSTLLGINEENITLDALKNISGVVMEVLGKVYPPAVYVGSAIVQGQVWKCLLYILVSLLAYVVILFGVAHFFEPICRGLHTTIAKHDYKLGKLEKRSLLRTMVAREAKLYFASGTYVSNTIIGPVLGMVGSIALIFVDLDKMTVGMPVALNFAGAVPFAIGAVFAMMNTTSVAVSMEGKEWWILKSLPLSAKTILDGKLLFSFCLTAPFYLVSVIALLIALRPGVLGAVWVILIPLLIIVFSSVFGITANLLFPKMDWDNEVTVVKQSASALLGMCGALIALVFAVPMLVVPALVSAKTTMFGLPLPELFGNVVCFVECMLLSVVTLLLYRRNSKVDLRGI